jgi:hypothetical protein
MLGNNNRRGICPEIVLLSEPDKTTGNGGGGRLEDEPEGQFEISKDGEPMVNRPSLYQGRTVIQSKGMRRIYAKGRGGEVELKLAFRYDKLIWIGRKVVSLHIRFSRARLVYGVGLIQVYRPHKI